jgi:WD repeat-containing protein 55
LRKQQPSLRISIFHFQKMEPNGCCVGASLYRKEAVWIRLKAVGMNGGGESSGLPQEISCGEQVFDLKFHPHADVLAAGLIDGNVEVYKYSPADGNGGSYMGEGNMNQHLLHLTHHSGHSCRGLEFDPYGQKLFTISSDHSWVCLDTTGAVISSHHNAHQAPLNKCLVIDENIFVTGDDNGCVKLWDIRSNTETMTFHKQEDFITSFSYYSDQFTLLCTSGDSTLCSYDIRKKISSLNNDANNVIKVSDEQESELTCHAVIKNGKKIVCGTQKGTILTFSWGKWGDCTDRYPGHPQPVDCILKIDENTILTGSSDGLIRVVGIQPNKIYGVLGDHEDFPVEGMVRSRDGLYLGTFSHDDVIRFWDMSMFVHDTPDGDEREGEGEESGGEEETKGDGNFVDEENEESESDEMSQEGEDDEEDEGGKVKARRKGNGDDDDSDEDSDDDDSSSDDDNGPSKMPPFRFPKKQTKKGFYADL